MENEIEICSASDQSSDDVNQTEVNYDLMSRYYQVMMNFLESGASEFF